MSSNIIPTPELAGLCTMVEYGDQILTIAVMAILLTAPLGGWKSVSLLPGLENSNNNQRRITIFGDGASYYLLLLLAKSAYFHT